MRGLKSRLAAMLDDGTLSHPARDAGIEMSSSLIGLRGNVSHPARDAGIEIWWSARGATSQSGCRILRGMRGLKCAVFVGNVEASRSHPARDAGIEIIRLAPSFGVA